MVPLDTLTVTYGRTSDVQPLSNAYKNWITQFQDIYDYCNSQTAWSDHNIFDLTSSHFDSYCFLISHNHDWLPPVLPLTTLHSWWDVWHICQFWPDTHSWSWLCTRKWCVHHHRQEAAEMMDMAVDSKIMIFSPTKKALQAWRHPGSNPSHDLESICTEPTVDTNGSLDCTNDDEVIFFRGICMCFWPWIRVGH